MLFTSLAIAGDQDLSKINHVSISCTCNNIGFFWVFFFFSYWNNELIYCYNAIFFQAITTVVSFLLFFFSSSQVSVEADPWRIPKDAPPQK